MYGWCPPPYPILFCPKNNFDDTALGIPIDQDMYFLKEILKQINKKYDK